MKIGIIGAGNIGSTLARKLAACGHDVKLANSKGPHYIQSLADEIGAQAVIKEEAVLGVEVVILSIPFGSYPDLAPLMSTVDKDVVVIDTSNYYPMRDGAIKEVDSGMPESIWVSKQIGRTVIKAWNAVLAATLSDKGQLVGSPMRIALPVAGGDMQTQLIAQRLVEDTGFEALAAGDLEESWRQQPGTPAYCTELTSSQLKLALQAANKARAPHNRDALMAKFMAPESKFTHDQIVEINRTVTA